MKIRIAEKSDLTRIDEIYNQAIALGQKTADLKPWEIEKREQWFYEHNSDFYPIYVYEIENEVVDYASISAYRPGREALKQTAEISIYIDNRYQYVGIGKQILKFVENDCRRIGVKTLFAIIIDSNVNSIRVMEKLGYIKWGHLPKIAIFNNIEVGHVYYGKRVCE